MNHEYLDAEEKNLIEAYDSVVPSNSYKPSVDDQKRLQAAA